jgi:hypothetical protein
MENDLLVIKFALMTIYKGQSSDASNNKYNISISEQYPNNYTTNLTIGSDTIEIKKIANIPFNYGLKVSDAELVTIREVDHPDDPVIADYESFYLIMAFDNPESFTNYLKIYTINYTDTSTLVDGHCKHQ